MGAVEAILIIIGVLFIVVSFFVTEKLTGKEMEEISRLSEAELKTVMEKNLQEVKDSLNVALDDVIHNTADRAERAMEKESNEKIMAISEYSDTVLDNINKTHKEVMFLYSMLNDRYDELTGFANEVNAFQAKLDAYREQMQSQEQVMQEFNANAVNASNVLNAANGYGQMATSKVQDVSPDMIQQPENVEFFAGQDEEEGLDFNIKDDSNHNKDILELYQEGLSEVDIARKLSLGIGEVRLVIDLYKGDFK